MSELIQTDVTLSGDPEYYDRIERVAEIQRFFESDWETAEQLTDFFDA